MRTRMQVGAVAVAAALALSSCSEADPAPAGGTAGGGSPAADAEMQWNGDVAAAVVNLVDRDESVVPAPTAGRALVVANEEGVQAWIPDPVRIFEEAFPDSGVDGWWAIRGLSTDAGVVLASIESEFSDSSMWAVGRLSGGDVTEVSCAEGSPTVVDVLEVGDEFLVSGGCGDDITAATIDPETGVLTDGEAVAPASAVWNSSAGQWVSVEAAPGACTSRGLLDEVTLAVTCDTEPSHFTIGTVTLATPDATSGAYVPDPDNGESSLFYFSTAFVEDGRLWVNSNTIEGTPMLLPAEHDEYGLTALGALDGAIFAGSGLDPWGGKEQGDPAIGWYDPATGDFAAMAIPADAAGAVGSNAYGVPVG